MANKLNTRNPESLSYTNQLLTKTVLGGIKLEGLDRMRVTLKVELKDSSRPPVRHNLDLYNDNQLEKNCRRASIGTHRCPRGLRCTTSRRGFLTRNSVGVLCPTQPSSLSIHADRIAKYNQLLRIEEQLGKMAYYPGKDFKYMP